MAERKTCANPGCEKNLQLNITIKDIVLFNAVVKHSTREVKLKNKKFLLPR